MCGHLGAGRPGRRPAVLVYVISALATHHSSKSSPVFIGPLVMCVLLAVQVGTMKVARTRTGTAG